MRLTLRWLVVLCSAVAGCTWGAQPRVFTVAPGGADTNPGIPEAPFRTLERARQAVREINRDMTADIPVELTMGTYTLTKPFRLGPEDSGTNGHCVVYRALPGATVVVSGGRRITGWTPDAGGRYKAPAPPVPFRQLYVNGTRARRARGPAPAGLAPWGEIRAEIRPTQGRNGIGALNVLAEAGYASTDAGLAQWRNPGDLELGYYDQWTHMICRVERVLPEGNGVRLVMAQPGFFLACRKGGTQAGMPNYLENALELLDEPGEWYLDRPAAMLYYLPRPGEDMASVQIVAPVLETLVAVQGTLDNPVHDVRFEGLTFAHATWNRPSELGHPDVQANFILPLDDLYQRPENERGIVSLNAECLRSPANVLVEAGQRIHFERCRFTALGGAGLDLQVGTTDSLVRGCRFDAISGSAVQVGDVTREDHHPTDPRRTVARNRIANNLITGIGVDYEDSIGVFCGYTEGTVIEHNEIANLPYTGISVGWGWGITDAGTSAYSSPVVFDTPTACRGNLIQFNHIHHVMQRRNDGGGIYTLSRQPGTLIRGNHIHDNGPGGPGGIYLDEGSSEIEVTGNAVYAVARPMNYNNYAQNRIASCNEHDNRFGALATAPGIAGQCLRAQPGSTVEVPYAPELDTPALTVEAWVRFEQYPSGWDPRRWAVCKAGNEWENTNYSLIVDKAEVSACLNLGGGRENDHELASTSSPVPLATWVPIAFTYDGQTLRVYCDGREVGAKAIGKPRITGPAGIRLGGRLDGYSVFEGDLDEVRIYRRALSAEELQRNAKAVRNAAGQPAGVVTEGLAGYWGFEDLRPDTAALAAVAAAAGLEAPYRKLLDE